MFGRLLLLFVLVPLLELAILVRLGALVGFWPTMGLVLLTGAAGAWLAKSQGLRLLRQIQGELAAGRIPATHLVDGLLVLIGGVVLLTPGLLTDVAGLLLLFPASRAVLRRALSARFRTMVRSGEVKYTIIR